MSTPDSADAFASPASDRSSSPAAAPQGVSATVRVPLWVKLAAVTALVASVPLVAIGAFVVDQNRSTLVLNAQRLQRAAAHDLARTLDQSFVRAEDHLDSIGRTLTDAALDPDARIGLALNLVAGAADLVEVAVYDTSGALIDAMREQGTEDALRAPRALAPALYQSAARRGMASLPVDRDAGGPFALVALPLYDQDKNLTGYVASPLRLSALQTHVERLSDDLFGGEPNALFVVDASKRYVAHTLYGKGPKWVSAASQGVLQYVTPGALEKPLLQNGSFTNDAPDTGTPKTYLSTLMADPDRRLAIVAQVDEARAFASITRLRQVVFGGIGVAVLLAILAALLFAKRLTGPLERLSKMSANLAARRFDARAPVETSDEIGVLAEAMNHAAGALAASDAQIKTDAAIRGDLGRYLPHELVDRVVRREQNMNLGGARTSVSILFADVVGFTPLVEKLEPEEVVALLNELFTFLTEIVFRHGGTVDKFIGDCVMAMFGAPTPHADHAERAVAAAEDMLRWLEIGNAKWEKQHGLRVQLAIGVHSGEAVIGNIGSESRMEYTAIGETVNIAARLESVARPQQVLVSGATHAMLDGAFDCTSLGTQKLAGVSSEIDVYALESM